MNVLDITHEEFDAIEWDDQIDILFHQMNEILHYDREPAEAKAVADAAKAAR